MKQANALLLGRDSEAFGDAGCPGAHKRNDAKDVHRHVVMCPGKGRAFDESSVQGRLLDEIERVTASRSAKVVHPFPAIRNLFDHRKARYKGLVKNAANCTAYSPWGNLVLARSRLVAIEA